MLNHRDKWLVIHQHKRELLALSLSPERQMEWAELELRLAVIQNRFLMVALALHWLHQIHVNYGV